MSSVVRGFRGPHNSAYYSANECAKDTSDDGKDCIAVETSQSRLSHKSRKTNELLTHYVYKHLTLPIQACFLLVPESEGRENSV